MSTFVSRENKADEAYVIIKDKIINFEYQPGAAITELELCEQLNMSRTPIRIAMARLTTEGFITELSPKKSIVTDISVDSFIHIFQLRDALDMLSVRSACYEWKEQEEIDTLRNMLNAQKELTKDGHVDSRSFLKLDREYHSGIAAITHNKLLCKQIGYIYDLYWRYNFYSMHVTGYRATVAEHESILNAIEHRDVALCAEYTSQHLQTVKEHILVGIAKGFTPKDMNKISTGYILR